MAHDLMAIFGAVLIVFGVTLLVLIDAPRWMVARLATLGGLRNRTSGARTVLHTTTNGNGTHASGAPAGQFALAAYRGLAPGWYRGLAPGWYRDSSNRALARYWDGVSLSAQTRPIAPPQQPAAAPQQPATAPAAPQQPAAAATPRPSPYVGLPPGWYRDEASPGMARFWNGTALGEERRLVAT